MLPAVKVENLSKEYVVGQSADRHATFYDTLSNALKSPFRKRDESTADASKFWALNDVSFEVQPGEVVGIIGRNGAGKSTLLKVLSRITAPTKGRIEVRGRLASLLEVGTGFHAELSGRENIFLNGAILGMTRRDIAKKFDEIVAFAEVEKFIDTPVKRYSSGMYVRLAFAVAAHLESDVLIVDEVLSVGDSSFQEKCMSKMGDLSQGGRTILFVSHNMGAVSKLCRTGVLLHAGQILHVGDVSGTLAKYETAAANDSLGLATVVRGPLEGSLQVSSVEIQGANPGCTVVVAPAAHIRLRTNYVVSEKIAGARLRFGIFKRGELVFSVYDCRDSADMSPGSYQSDAVIPAKYLSPGNYHLDITAYSSENGAWVRVSNAASFTVTSEWLTGYENNESMGVVNPGFVGTRQQVDS